MTNVNVLHKITLKLSTNTHTHGTFHVNNNSDRERERKYEHLNENNRFRLIDLYTYKILYIEYDNHQCHASTLLQLRCFALNFYVGPCALFFMCGCDLSANATMHVNKLEPNFSFARDRVNNGTCGVHLCDYDYCSFISFASTCISLG